MNKVFFTLILAILLTGCYKDKGSYNYTELQEVDIQLPSISPTAIGDTLKIQPTVSTDIGQSDLTYHWEIGFQDPSLNNPYKFVKIYEGKDLNYKIQLNDTIRGPGQYSMRLHVIQKSSGRSFYSTVANVSVNTSYVGLMVLHGNDQESDIGLIRANEFNITASASSYATRIFDLYSSVNNTKLKGKGRAILQTATAFLSDVNRASVIAFTDQEGAWLGYAGFEKKSDWNGKFNSGINDGKPEYATINNTYIYAVDNSKLFVLNNNTYTIFVVPGPVPSRFKAGSSIYSAVGADVGFFYDKNLRAFIQTNSFNSFNQLTSSAQNSFSIMGSSNGVDLGDLKSDLLSIERGGGSNNYAAVLKNDNNQKYMVTLGWTSVPPPGNIGAPIITQTVNRYSMDGLPGISNANFFAFGQNVPTKCYYSSGNKIYRFTVSPDNLNLGSAYNELRYDNGTPLSIDGEITMMKVLKPLVTTGALGVNYQNFDKILVVATYKNGVGTLYSLRLNDATGDIVSMNSYTGFQKIFDVNIKGL